MKKLTVAVFFGSRSAEHDVSIVTALASIVKPLQLTNKYRIVPVYIAKDGQWYSDEKLKDINLYSSGKIDEWMTMQKPLAVQFDGGLTLLKRGIKTKTIKVDVAFPATHGTHGEDGDLMGVFEMANVPYVGCNVQASAVAMDKVTSKLVAEVAGIPITKFIFFTDLEYKSEAKDVVATIQKKLKYPLFVKPAHLGSSIAISKVSNKTELENAIELAFHYDDKVLVEEGVNNLIEVTQPILGNDKLMLAHLEQPLPPENGVFDFDTKYLSQGKGGKKMGSHSEATQGSQGYSKLPADLPKKLYSEAQHLAVVVYRALGCSGMARVDMLIDSKTGNIYFNEVNPLPGSLYAHNWRSIGVSNVELAEKLVALAQERFAQRQKLSTTFATNFLKQF